MCKHDNTTVTNSRAPDCLNWSGKRMFKPLKYPCLVIRQRKCLECGERFKTVEVRKDYIDAIPTPEDIRKGVMGELREFLDSEAV